MVYYSSSMPKYQGSAGGSSTYAGSSAYVVKSNSVCCGSFSRGQRCRGCPGG
ncbi:MAG TPA: hypothetical protein VJI15_05070 [Candidatus Nanoarchaeia archaeon]|nr:hypothetical protein [Candidatus Nanoarchaeia archaeon]